MPNLEGLEIDDAAPGEEPQRDKMEVEKEDFKNNDGKN